MVKFGHDGPQVYCQKTWWAGHDGVNISRWNLEVEPFVVWWIIQKQKNTHMLGVSKNYMIPWNVVRKGRCCCWLMIKIQEGKDIGQP